MERGGAAEGNGQWWERCHLAMMVDLKKCISDKIFEGLPLDIFSLSVNFYPFRNSDQG